MERCRGQVIPARWRGGHGRRGSALLRACAVALGATCLGVIPAQAAPSDDADTEVAIEKITELFCGTSGRLMRCAGTPERECAPTIRPFVQACYPIRADRSQSPEEVLQSCFWREFRKSYGKGREDLAKCAQLEAQNEEENPLQPMPPEMARKYRSLADFERERKLRSEGTGQGSQRSPFGEPATKGPDPRGTAGYPVPLFPEGSR